MTSYFSGQTFYIMAGRGDAPKSKGKKKPAGSKKAGPTSSGKKSAATKKDSNRGKRGSSRDRDMEYRTDTRFSENAPDKKFGDKKYVDKKFGDKKFSDKPYSEKSYGDKKPYGKSKEGGYKDDKRIPKGKKKPGQGEVKQFFTSKYSGEKPEGWKPKVHDGLTRLNKYLSNAGIASRRDADKLIELGLVKVNDVVVTELGYKVDPKKDTVKYDDKNLKPEKLRYVLLNKPKDYITTMEDPEERKTVMWLVKDACKERIYPVGRLDRQTTGLLLFTNDGEMAKKLTHPKHGIQKLYHVETLEKVKGADLDAMRNGIKLDDGIIKADEVSFVNNDVHQIGIRIHSGRNRIVRRMFEHFNYTVKKLDRVMFAGLTKKDLPRGRCRHLTEQELAFLQML